MKSPGDKGPLDFSQCYLYREAAAGLAAPPPDLGPRPRPAAGAGEGPAWVAAAGPAPAPAPANRSWPLQSAAAIAQLALLGLLGL